MATDQGATGPESLGSTPAPPSGGRRLTARQVRIVAALVLLGLLIAFVLDNTERVRVGFVFFHARVQLIWALVASAVVGAVVALLTKHRWANRTRRSRSRRDGGAPPAI